MPPTSGSDYTARRLRPEANAMDWSYLNKSQQEAFRRSLYVIEEAVEGLPTTQESPLAELIDVGRESRSVFLSGDRGSGKTSVLLSLMAYTLPYRSGLTPPDYKSTNDRFETALNKMKKRVVWLKPIDMEPLPVAFSLLASILIRIEEACERITRSNRDDRFRGPGNGDALFSEAMQELQMLQSEISLAWESNLPERRSSLDPDSFSIEVMRTARAGLGISNRLNRILNRIAEEVFPAGSIEDPLFVVTIDDFDMHPSSCLQVLRLLRMLSCPRLFFLMLGDFRLLEMMLNLQLSNELASVTENRPESILSYRPQELAREAAAIAATSLRKMLPPDQRARVGNMTVAEGVCICPAPVKGEESLRLYQLLHKLPVAVAATLTPPASDSQQDDSTTEDSKQAEQQTFLCGLRVQVMTDLLLNPGFSVFENADKDKLSSDDAAENSLDTPADKLRKYRTRCSKRIRPIRIRKDGKDQPRLQLSDFKEHPQAQSQPGDELKRIEEFCSETDGVCGHWPVYSGLYWLETSPRRATDAWFALRRLSDAVVREARKLVEEKLDAKLNSRFVHDHSQKLLKVLMWHCREALLEEPVFSPGQRQDIRMAMTQSPEGIWNWATLPVSFHSRRDIPSIVRSRWNRHLLWILTEESQDRDPESLEEDEKRGRRIRHSIQLSRPLGWYAQADSDGDDSAAWRDGVPIQRTQNLRDPDVSRELSRATTGLMTLCHDILELGPGGDSFEGSLLPRNSADWLSWAVTQYRGRPREEVHLPWPAPRCVSVFGMDLFRSAWREVHDKWVAEPDENENCFAGTSEKPAEKSETPVENPEAQPILTLTERLAFAWISAGTAAVTGTAPAQCRTAESNTPLQDDDWERLHIVLNQAACRYFQLIQRPDTPFALIIRDWLISVSLLVMPEYGLPEIVLLRVLFGMNTTPGTRKQLWDEEPKGDDITDARQMDFYPEKRLATLKERFATSQFREGIVQAVEGTSTASDQWDEFWSGYTKRAVEFRDQIGEKTSLQDVPSKFDQEEGWNWFLVFLNFERREIRERRADVLGRIRASIGEQGEFAERLRLSCSEFLAPADLLNSRYAGALFGMTVPDKDISKEEKKKFRKAVQEKKTHNQATLPGAVFKGRGLVPPLRSVKAAAHRYRWEWDAPGWLKNSTGDWEGTLPIWLRDILEAATAGKSVLTAINEAVENKAVTKDDPEKSSIVSELRRFLENASGTAENAENLIPPLIHFLKNSSRSDAANKVSDRVKKKKKAKNKS